MLLVINICHMSTEHKIVLRSTASAKIGEIGNFTDLVYTKKRNDPGLCTFKLNGNDSKVSLFTDDIQVEVWRRNKALALAWYKDFEGLYRAEQQEESKSKVFTAMCPGQMCMLGDRIIAYPKGTVNRTVFTAKPVETIMHTLVKYNTTSSGSTADGRVRLATITGITMPTDGAHGSSIDWGDCAEKNLLDELQNIAAKTKTFFIFSRTGLAAWQWSWGTATDVSSKVIFALDRSNVEKITYEKDRRNEATVAIVGGKGLESTRDYYTRTGTNYSSTNDREIFVSVSDEDTVANLYARADAALKEKEAIPKITFSVIQSPNAYYGLDYDLNYIVKGRYGSTTRTLVVSEVTVAVQTGNPEKVTTKLEDV